MEEIKCSKCRKYLPANEKYFSPRPNRSRGFSYTCKSCINSKNKQDSLDRKIAKFAAITEKHCKSCNTTKPIGEFRRRSGRNFGWVTSCIECELVVNRKYFADNPEKRKQYTSDNKTHRSKVSKEWYEANKKKVLSNQKLRRLANPELAREKYLKFYPNNKHKYALASRRRDVIIKNVTMEFNELTRFITEEIYKLRDLRTSLIGVVWQVDHIVPLNSWLVQGLHCGTNLQLLPASVNIAKGNRHWPQMPEYSRQDKHELKYYKWLSERANNLDTNLKLC